MSELCKLTERLDEIINQCNENDYIPTSVLHEMVSKLRTDVEKFEKALQEIKDGSAKGDYCTGWSYEIADRVLKGESLNG